MDKSENYLRKSTESHQIQTPCQICFWSCFIHFLGTVSTDYFSQSLAISECFPYYPSNIAPIDIPPDKLLIAITIYKDYFFHIHEE